ncbi:hypothetical protein [Microcoleus sp.]|uniref:hypothetical protein n=1 Tax=Microcoleus sp. TaxID=44472 RepID=UPI00359404F0
MPSETSRIRKAWRIMQSLKLLQHNGNFFSLVGRMRTRDALQAIGHRSQSRYFTKFLGGEVKS